VTDERSDLMLEILKHIQADLGDVKREQVSQGMRLSSLEDHFRGTLTTLYSIQDNVAHLKTRVDHIERRLGLRDTEH